MAGTKAGGKKAAETNKKIYGANFYAEIGRKSIRYPFYLSCDQAHS